MRQLFFFFALFAGLTSFADPDPETDAIGKILGVVIDKSLEEPIAYVTVVIKDTDGNILTGGLPTKTVNFILKTFLPENRT